MARRRIAAPAFALAAALVGLVAPAARANFDDPTQRGPLRPMTFPVIGKVSFSDSFLAPRSGGRQHQGQDIMGSKMQPLIAAAAGRVTRLTIPEPSYGYSLVITDDEGWSYHYLHVNDDTPGTDDGRAALEHVFAPGLIEGARVNAGQLVAYLGDSGNAESTSPHLHFELHDPTGAAVNAYASLVAAPRLATPAPAAQPPALPRVAGADRVATALAASKAGWSTGATHVVLASGERYAEALPASVLAAAHDGPLLLHDGGPAAPAVLEEVARLRATGATVVGSVPLAVDAALAARGLTVQRLSGPDDAGTAALVARAVARAAGADAGTGLDIVDGVLGTTTAVVVNGSRFADGISAAGLGAPRGWPILLVGEAGVPAATAAALDELGVERTYVVGGPVVVPDAVAAALPGARRVAGADRYATSVAAVQRSVSSGLVTNDVTWLATGNAFPDALAAGALAARTRGVVLLIDGSLSRGDRASRDYLRWSGASLAGVLGGPAAVHPAVGWLLGDLLGLE